MKARREEFSRGIDYERKEPAGGGDRACLISHISANGEKGGKGRMIARRYAAVPIRVSAVIAFASIVLTRSAPRNVTTLLGSRGPESRP